MTGVFHVVLPPSAHRGGTRRGFRHAVRQGAERTLCGLVCDEWPSEVPTGPLDLTCVRCTAAFKKAQAPHG